GDDIDGSDPKYKPAAVYARDAYDLYVPHYPFPDGGREGIYQSFVLGNVLFVMTDNRFNKLGRGSDTSKRSMLGIQQREWLKSQLLEGRKYDLVVWCNSLPWVGKAHPREVFWAGFSDERTNISLFIVENQIRNLCMLSGDAHMLAIDDGTNTGFTPNGKGGFPLFHAAAMESRPTRKGGIYTKGSKDGKPGLGIAGTGQYGVMEVKYPPASDSPRVFWTGKRVKKRSKNPEDFQCQILLLHEFIARSATLL
ncbi:MAG TPA: alkaline phosphatase D family protein, partial [Acidobacteriota bacterium]|nr:alkaline phosphatase D family protein [Acidobacteriota bacterium]